MFNGIRGLNSMIHYNSGVMRLSRSLQSNFFLNKNYLSDIMVNKNYSSCVKIEHDSQFVIKTSIENDVGIVEFDSPKSKMITLNMENIRQIRESIEKLSHEPNLIGVVVLSGKQNCFISGADIKSLSGIRSTQEGQKLSLEVQNIFSKIEGSKIPIVAAINGYCLGGGLELALSCSGAIGLNYRSTMIGFPEVRLGLLPGGGGCVRSFNKIMCWNALNMILSGSAVNVIEAHRLGYVDMVVKPVGPGVKPGYEASLQLLRNVAIKYATQLANHKEKKSKYVNFEKKKYYFALWLAKMRINLETHGLYPAPYKILQVFKDFSTHPNNIPNQFHIESQAFGELIMSNESKNLIHVYLKQNEVKNRDYGTPQNTIKWIGIIGSGLMGSGITEVSASPNLFKIVCVDLSETMLVSNYRKLEQSLLKKVARGRIPKFQKELIINSIKFSTHLRDIKNCDMVIEATDEDLSTKKMVISQFESITQPHAILATNTSALSLKEILQDSQRPQNIIGMHYFSPVPRMQLVEIVKHPQLSKETLELAVDVARKQGKLCIIVNDSPGFFTTRVLFATLCEILNLFKEGVTPHMVDKETTKFGFAFGSASLIDQIGIDVCIKIFDYMHEKFGQRFSHVDSTLLKSLAEEGNLGAKSNKGIYTYPYMIKFLKTFQKLASISKSNVPIYPMVSREFKKLTANKSLDPSISDEDIRMRIICKFINECILCLEEGIIESPTDGDIGSIFGLGFPARLGGPFKFVDDFGAKNIVKLIETYNQKFHRSDFHACKLLKDYATTNRKFF